MKSKVLIEMQAGGAWCVVRRPLAPRGFVPGRAEIIAADHEKLSDARGVFDRETGYVAPKRKKTHHHHRRPQCAK